VVFYGDPIHAWLDRFTARVVPAAIPPTAPQPDPETYAQLKGSLADWRKQLATKHAAARTIRERDAVLDDARIVLESALPGMMRCWLGTPWDFHGTAENPGGGKIACGYFVSTILRDAGFQVHRYHLAQQPSGNILRTFLPRDSCKLTTGQDYETFANTLEAAEPGIYIVGLDTHVGFIVVRDGELRFIHSSGSRPWAVVEESRTNAHVLRQSNWRMLGHLTTDRDALRKWLAGTSFAVHGR
jgi:hypothetical protein